MTVYRINTTYANNGDGSAWTAAATPGGVGAKNTTSGISYADGNIYVWDYGVTQTLQINPSAGTVASPIVLCSRAYYDGIPGARPMFRPVGTGVRNIGRGVNIIDLDILGGGSSAAVSIESGGTSYMLGCDLAAPAGVDVVVYQAASASAFVDNAIELCTWNRTGRRGVAFLGSTADLTHSGWRINGCEFDGLGGLAKGIQLSLVNAADATGTINDTIIEHNTFTNLSGLSCFVVGAYAVEGGFTPQTVWGDGLKFRWNTVTDCGSVAETGSPDFVAVQNFDIAYNEILRCGTAGALIQGQKRKRGSIHHNTLAFAYSSNDIDGNGVFADRYDDGLSIYGNQISDLPGVVGAAGTGVGISLWMAVNTWVWSNVIERAKYGLSAGGNDDYPTEDCSVFNNTVVDPVVAGFYGFADDADFGPTVVALTNNAFVRCPVGVDGGGQPGLSADYNAFVACDEAYGTSQGSGAHDLELTTEQALLSASNRPMAGSPVIAAGISFGAVRDADGNQFWTTPSIGAFEYVRPKTAATARTMGTARTASTARTMRTIAA